MTFLQVYEFDPAEYLEDEAAIEAYLASAIAEGDAEGIDYARLVAARARARLQRSAGD
jgi:DNA-binding phage protein